MTSTNDARESLRGEGERLFNLVAREGSGEQWAKLLEAPLECAAGEGDVGLSERLVEAGAGFGAALHVAVEGGHERIVDLLLETEACANSLNANGDTPLHLAAQHNRPKLARSLLLKGADKDRPGNTIGAPGSIHDRETALHRAARLGHLAVVQVLLDAGADFALRSGLGSPLEIAAHNGHVNIVRALIAHGVDVNEVGDGHTTAIGYGVFSARVEVVDVLLEAGATVSSGEVLFGMSALSLASGSDYHLEIVRTLLKHGADANWATQGFLGAGSTPLHNAAKLAGRCATVAATMVDLLLRHGADETAIDGSGATPADIVRRFLGVPAGDPGNFDAPEASPEDIELVWKLLVNAPADRAWRRRGFLVMCRAHPDRLRLGRQSGQRHAGAAPRTRSRVKESGAEAASGGGSGNGAAAGSGSGAAAGSVAQEKAGGHDWGVAAANLVRLGEEDIFRRVVEYL